MNSHNPFNTGGSGCTNDFRSADQLVDRIIGDAYHVVKEVYLALGNLTYIYNYLQKYGLIITVDSEDAIKDIPLAIGKFARVYNKSESTGYYFTDYLYVADDTTGIPSNDPTATGSWVSTKSTGSNASFVRIWKYKAVSDGETVIHLPTDMPIVDVQTIYVQGSRQDAGEGFVYNEGNATITLADELEVGNLVTVIIGITDPDMDIDIFTLLEKEDAASKIGTSTGDTVETRLTTLDSKVDPNLRSNLGSLDGLKLIGQCPDLNSLRAVEPTSPGQQIYLESLYGGWAATAAGMPWGGGKLRYIPNLPASLQVDDGGSIIKTAGGKCWVREELLTGQGEIRVEWYLVGGATLVEDGSDYLQAALDTGKLWSQYSDRNKTVRVIMPSLMRITRTITAYTRGVRIDGNHGMLLCTADVEYTKYADLSTNANITVTPDTGKDPRLCISLTHGPGGDPAPGFPLPAYSGQKLIKDLNFAYGVATGVSTYQLSTLADTGIAAIGHWGTSTVAAAQGYFENLSFQGFGVGYINGDNTWGYGFHECKWRQCWLPVWLIPGADNSERYTFIDCVMQDGYRVIYSPWGGDIKFISGSIVHNSGPELEFPTGSNIIDLSPSRIERVDNAHKFLRLSTSRETGDTAQTYPMAHLHDSMILIDGSSVLDAHALFSVGKYCKLLVDNHTWSLKNMAALANMKLLDPADTGGQVIFRNNTCRVGIFSECARDNRLLTSKVPAGRLPSSNITLSGSNAENASISVSGASLTLTVNASAGGSMALLLRVPVDVDMTDWDSFSWKCVFSAMSISNAWNIQAFANVAGADYVNNRVDLGVASLNSVADISDVCSNNSYGFKRIQKRADGGWDRVPTEVYFYISSAGAQTAGETFTITRLGLLGY